MSAIWTTLFGLVFVIAIVLGLAWLATRLIAAKAARTISEPGQRVAVRGGAIHYVDEGPRDGVPLVLIHGLAGNLRHFTHSLTNLLTDEFRVIVLDRPGTGQSTRDDDDLAALPDQARMIGEFLDKLEIRNPVLVGHSLGGAIALAMALDRPGKVAGLALICPLTQVIAEPPPVFKPLLVGSKWLRRGIGHTVAVPLAALTLSHTLKQVSAPDPVPEDMMVRGGGNKGMRPSGYITASADLIGAKTSMPGVVARYGSGLETPGGVLFGAEDPLLAPDLHGRSMQSFGLSCEELSGRGHMIPITAPQECAAFIRKVAGGRRG